ncbi:hypothetical protein [Clostridium beijerinckii]|uniref:hypothetical protein n=1 Tax=Clostridium beijerinckii TaxID=1520 RepID=UPI00031EF69A|nr:hypothetical protein [Clostridium beijerinckii]
MKIVEWNIHQMTNLKGTNMIPKLVIEELKEQVADIIVLTEFFKVTDWTGFVNELAEYNTFVSDNSKNNQNDVLIAVKKELRIIKVKDIGCIKENNNPNFLSVDVEIEDKILSIIGVRIRVESINRKYYKTDEEYEKVMKKEKENRRKQNNIILNHICHIKNPIIVIGDFNNFRRGYKDEVWCMDMVKGSYEKNGFTMADIKGESINQETHDIKYQFAEDHLIAKNVEVSNPEYNRNFVERDKNIYKWGRDFSFLYNDKDKWNNEYVQSPYPDHAILTATIKLKNS